MAADSSLLPDASATERRPPTPQPIDIKTAAQQQQQHDCQHKHHQQQQQSPPSPRTPPPSHRPSSSSSTSPLRPVACSSSGPSASASSPFSARYALARRRRECLGLIDSLRLSMGLSLKAIALLVCCVMMTVQHRAQQRRRTAAAAAAAATADAASASASSSLPFSLLSCLTQSSSPTFYQTLCIPSTASAAEVKAAHRKLAVRYHPDKVQAARSRLDPSAAAGDSADVQSRFIAIQEAYEVLSDAYERRRYDYCLLTSAQYARLPQSMRDSRSRADEEKEDKELAFYCRRRPAAFTGAAQRGQGGSEQQQQRQQQDSSASSTSSSSSSTASGVQSGAASASASTTPPAAFRSSRSFSSLFTSPFAEPSHAAAAAGAGSPLHHSPVPSPSVPSSPNGSSSLASSRAACFASPAASSSSSSSPPPSGHHPGLFSSLRLDPHRSLAGLFRWFSLLLLTFVLFPLRLCIALSILARHRRMRRGQEPDKAAMGIDGERAAAASACAMDMAAEAMNKAAPGLRPSVVY